MRPLRTLALGLCIASNAVPAGAAELARPNDIEEGFLLWSSSAEYEAFWKADPPRNAWLLADAVASTYDVGTRALRAGHGERAYRMWLPLAQAGNCRAKFAVGYLLDPASPAALRSVTSAGREVSAETRAAAAFAWYLSAAEEGWPAAQRRVGDAYAAGKAVPADPEAAELWYRRAARAMDPDAMLALANVLQRSDTLAERIEGLAWALIARDRRDLFWIDDGGVQPLIASYEADLSPVDVLAARQIAYDWWPLTYLIGREGVSEYSGNRDASRRMFGDLSPSRESAAAVFDRGAIAVLEGRRQDAFDAWWPLARRGYCGAQLAASFLLHSSSQGAAQSDDYPDDESLTPLDAWETTIMHSAMQGLPLAQTEVPGIMLSPHYSLPQLNEAAQRWTERAAAQGYLPDLRTVVENHYVGYGSDPTICFYMARLFRRTGIDLYGTMVEECRSMLSPGLAAEIEQEALEWRPETP